MGGILFPFNQYSNIYSRLLEKDDAENKFTASAEEAMIQRYLIMNY